MFCFSVSPMAGPSIPVSFKMAAYFSISSKYAFCAATEFADGFFTCSSWPKKYCCCLATFAYLRCSLSMAFSYGIDEVPATATVSSAGPLSDSSNFWSLIGSGKFWSWTIGLKPRQNAPHSLGQLLPPLNFGIFSELASLSDNVSRP